MFDKIILKPIFDNGRANIYAIRDTDNVLKYLCAKQICQMSSFRVKTLWI